MVISELFAYIAYSFVDPLAWASNLLRSVKTDERSLAPGGPSGFRVGEERPDGN